VKVRKIIEMGRIQFLEPEPNSVSGYHGRVGLVRWVWPGQHWPNWADDGISAHGLGEEYKCVSIFQTFYIKAN
jgi:hypothetical protein